MKIANSCLLPIALCALGGALAAQGPAFQSPGLSRYSTLGQTTRFSREFNPALGGVLDTFLDFEDREAGEDGFDLQLRLLELNVATFVDPDVWIYAVIVSEELEPFVIDEAAVEYIGFEGHSRLKAGRFFVDFGKQMQMHTEELRTLERPLPLREFLGEELAGTGVQYDTWFAAGESTPVRFSLGAFGQLTPGSEPEDGDPFTLEASARDEKDFGELSFTARVTGMTDVGERGQLQFGASTRVLPDYSFDLAFDDGTTAFASTVEGLSELVWGADLTYGRTDDTATRTLLLGGEVLVADGDLSAAPDVATTSFAVNDDRAVGWFAFGDYAWSQFDSAGLQLAHADLRADPTTDRLEAEVYWTHHFAEWRRLRVGTIWSDTGGEEDWRFYVQFTNFYGSHAHGLNW